MLFVKLTSKILLGKEFGSYSEESISKANRKTTRRKYVKVLSRERGCEMKVPRLLCGWMP